MDDVQDERQVIGNLVVWFEHRCSTGVFSLGRPAVARSAPLPEPAPPPDVAVQSAARDPEVGSSVGSRTPDFEMRLADGTLVTFASLNAESRPAFLFFFATW